MALTQRQRLTAGMVLTILTGVTGCETIEKTDREVPVTERVVTERAHAAKVLPWVDPYISQEESNDLSPFLTRTTERLALSAPLLRGMKFQILLGGDVFTKWQSLAVPGRKMILSRSVLQRLDFENQLAALISIELGHVLQRTLLNRLESGGFESRDAGGGSGAKGQAAAQRLLSFSEDEISEAVRVGLQLLYRAKYDVRGMILLWDLYAKNPDRSPYSPRVLKRLRELTRAEIVQYAPVVDPVVRSDEFVRIQKKLRDL